MRQLIKIFALALTVMAGTAQAQGLFSPMITVDDKVITQFEVNQRIALMRVLRTQGNLQILAREQLIEDRLKVAAAERLGIFLPDEAVQTGMEEFAGRANVTLPEFLTTLKDNGIEATSLRELVLSGLTWREVIRTQFNRRANITEAEVDRALAATGSQGGVRVLLNEIILPARPIDNEVATAQQNAARLQNIRSTAAFSDEARKLSVAPSRENGGRLDWLALGNLPQQLRGVVLGLKPGEVSAPIEVPNALILFQLRAIEETEAQAPEIAAIDYAVLYLPGGSTADGQKAAQKIHDRVDTCDDLYGIAQNMAPERLERSALAPTDIPDDIAIELAKLDAGEVSTALTRSNGETVVFLMLCGRSTAIQEAASRESVRNQLRQRRLGNYADGYLAELRADALITNR